MQVSAFSFGSWVTFGNQIENNSAETLMKTAYDAGINFFDNAELYADGKSEEVMGDILKKNGMEQGYLFGFLQSLLGWKTTQSVWLEP